MIGKWNAIARRARASDHRWIAPSAASVEKQLAPGYPLWRRCEHALFVHADDARCSAIVNPRLAEADGTPYGQVGWFEAATEDGAGRVLDEACAWLRERGCRTALGPMNGSTWHSYRFAVGDAGGEPGFLLEPTNPPDYPVWWERHGFARHGVEYFSSVQDNTEAARTLATASAVADGKGYRVEAIDLAGLDAALRKIHEISLLVFRANPLFSEIDWEEFAALYDGIERVLEPRLVHWLRDPAGAIAGFGFGLPDRAEAVRRMRGESGLLAKLRYLTGPRARRSIFKSMGILPEHQGKGLASALFHRQAAESIALGMPTGIRALMAGGNRSFETGRDLHRVIRTYALFARAA